MLGEARRCIRIKPDIFIEKKSRRKIVSMQHCQGGRQSLWSLLLIVL